jgi:mRNA interferase RelE/StbE
MQVTLSRTAAKALRRMPRTDANALLAKLDLWATTGQGDVRPLSGASGLFRLRHGDWRAVFEVREGVLALLIAHRREVYR